MERILTLTLILISTWGCGQSDFSRLSVTTDSTYGYTDTNPLKLKKGNPEKSIGYSYDFLHGLRTHDDQKLKFVKRTTVDNPNYKRPNVQSTDPHTGTPINEKGSKLDKYIFLTSGNKDTVTIYVDVHRRGDLKIPMGLTYK